MRHLQWPLHHLKKDESGLVAARNTIKSKFNRAYADRMQRERDTCEIFKPITSTIADLKFDATKEGENKKYNYSDLLYYLFMLVRFSCSTVCGRITLANTGAFLSVHINFSQETLCPQQQQFDNPWVCIYRNNKKPVIFNLRWF